MYGVVNAEIARAEQTKLTAIVASTIFDFLDP